MIKTALTIFLCLIIQVSAGGFVHIGNFKAAQADLDNDPYHYDPENPYGDNYDPKDPYGEKDVKQVPESENNPDLIEIDR